MAEAIFYGCTTRANPALKNSLDRVLAKIQLDFIPMGLDLCCGAPLFLSGHVDEAKKQAEKVINEFKIHDIDTVITPCPHCFTVIGQEYKEVLNVKMPEVKVLHITEFIKKKIVDGTLKPEKEVNVRVTYHDPCYIGRQGKGLYDEPRFILNSIPGVKLQETSLNRESATCCGGGGLLRAYLPRLAVEIAKEKIKSQFIPLNSDFIVSSCPFCYINLSEGAEGESIEVKDITEILDMALEQ